MEMKVDRKDRDNNSSVWVESQCRLELSFNSHARNFKVKFLNPRGDEVCVCRGPYIQMMCHYEWVWQSDVPQKKRGKEYRLYGPCQCRWRAADYTTRAGDRTMEKTATAVPDISLSAFQHHTGFPWQLSVWIHSMKPWWCSRTLLMFEWLELERKSECEMSGKL